jgi:hypothetical protein
VKCADGKFDDKFVWSRDFSEVRHFASDVIGAGLSRLGFERVSSGLEWVHSRIPEHLSGHMFSRSIPDTGKGITSLRRGEFPYKTV